MGQGAGRGDGGKWRGPEAQKRQNQPASVMIKMWVWMGIVKGDAQASGLVTQVKEHFWGKDVEPRVIFVGLW